MALRYGSKIASSLRYNPYSALALRYGSKNAWNSGLTPTDSKYFSFELCAADAYMIYAADIENMPADVILPSTYNGLPVRILPDTGVFKGCKTITSVVIPDSYTYIGMEAFSDCTNLSDITIADSGIEIVYGAFSNTAYYNNESNWEDSVLYIGNHLIIVNSPEIVSFTIRDGIVSIAEGAFRFCDRLISVVIPDSVTTIGQYAFTSDIDTTIYCEAPSKPDGWADNWQGGSSSKTTVVWGLLDDEYLTFTLLDNDTYSVKPRDVTTLPSVIAIPWEYNGKAVTAIDENAFYSATINKVVIPEGVTRIGNGAFDNCKRLLDVSLPSTLTEIGGWAFRDCTALTSIVIPIGVTTIGTWAFLRDMSLTINCEAASQPSGWHTDWNISGGTVVWGYTG